MDVHEVPAALRERLGAEASFGLAEYVKDHTGGLRMDLVSGLASLRLDLADDRATLRAEAHADRLAIRNELAEWRVGLAGDLSTGVAAVRQELATSRVELLKWAFLFWIGQVAAVSAVLSALLRR